MLRLVLIFLFSFSINAPSVFAYKSCANLVATGAQKFEIIARMARVIYRVKFGPGYMRGGTKANPIYYDTNGYEITDTRRLNFIKKLGIPPAWKDVWISPNPDSHVLCRGVDEAGRTQKIYHPRWVVAASKYKFDRIIEFGRRMPALRQAVREDLSGNTLSKNRIIAGVLQLMDLRPIRVGSQESANTYEHYGATTLRKKHVKSLGTKNITLLFDGKHGVEHDIVVGHAELVRLFRQLVDQPGYEIFRYVDNNGAVRQINEGDINEYLKKYLGDGFSVKDIRTWSGTVKAMEVLASFRETTDIDQRLVNLEQTFQVVGEHLVNEPSESRDSYIHPDIVDAYEAGSLLDDLAPGRIDNSFWFSDSERITLRFFNP